MIVLNLGCGTKTSDHCVNIDWSFYLRIKNNPVLRLLSSSIIGAERRERLNSLSTNIMVHDIRKGIPFANSSVDAVYHSHVLEHIDREYINSFQMEVHRVLKVNGIQRICVPDLEKPIRRYLESVDRCQADPDNVRQHDSFVHEILEQSVRKEAFGSSLRPPLQRTLENWLLGDARRRGETHQWMYDRFNLTDVLQKAGFAGIRVCAWNESAIVGWTTMGLEVDASGNEYMSNSLYVECRK